MTKKHYEVIANILANTRPKKENTKEFEKWEEITGALVQYMHQDNPRFDILRFMRAVNKL